MRTLFKGMWQHNQNSINLPLDDIMYTVYQKGKQKTRHTNKT